MSSDYLQRSKLQVLHRVASDRVGRIAAGLLPFLLQNEFLQPFVAGEFHVFYPSTSTLVAHTAVNACCLMLSFFVLRRCAHRDKDATNLICFWHLGYVQCCVCHPEPTVVHIRFYLEFMCGCKSHCCYWVSSCLLHFLDAPPFAFNHPFFSQHRGRERAGGQHVSCKCTGERCTWARAVNKD